MLYRGFGIVRNRGDCMQRGFEVWFGGYPRSANTFCVAQFKLANPGVPIASHWHIPAFIIHALDLQKPGIFLIRRPVDSIISWTIFWDGHLRLRDSLEYYLDFHHAMLPYRDKLFMAPFDRAICDFQSLLRAFNLRFGTNYAAPEPGHKTREDCLAQVENWLRAPDGSVNELMVSRPSPKRAAIKAQLTDTLRNSPALCRKLEMADELYDVFTEGIETRSSTTFHAPVPTNRPRLPA